MNGRGVDPYDLYSHTSTDKEFSIEVTHVPPARAGTVPQELATGMLDGAIENGDIAPEIGDILKALVPGMNGDALESLMTDAWAARALMDEGRTEEARAIIAQYRVMAEQSGLAPLFDAMFDSILHG